MLRLLISGVLLMLCLSTLQAQPPTPAEGYRWMLNRQFSDEFNGDQLDLEKWYNYHPGWKGRPPAIFLPSQVSVKDGLLQIKNKKLDKDTVVTFWNGTQATYTIAGGAVVSRTKEAHYGYYECSQKASKIRMSSTFWMTSSTYPGSDPCPEDKFAQELDIQESVGGADTPGTLRARKSMGSNSHYNYTNCDGVKQGYSRGSNIELEEGEVSDTFHVYAAHWKNANVADMYLDGKYGARINFRTDFDDTPFHKPMQINMVTETYDWVVPPDEEDLADDTRNTTYIDYVRSWKLVEVDFQEEVTDKLVKNGGFESGDLSPWIGWGGNPREVNSDNPYSGEYAVHIGGPGAPEYAVNLRAFTTYTLSCYGMVAEGSAAITLGIKDSQEKNLGSVQVTENNYTRKSFTFTTGSSGAGLKFYFYAPASGVEGWGDDFSLVMEDPDPVPEEEEVEIFIESLVFNDRPAALPANIPIEIPVLYQANGDRQIHLQLRDSDSLLIQEQIYPGLAGYGLKILSMKVDPLLSAGEEYMLIADLRHLDSTDADPRKLDMIRLAFLNPVEVRVKVLDIRDHKPLENVSVSIHEKEILTSAEGMAVFAEVSAGDYSIQVKKEGYESQVMDGLEAIKDTLIEVIFTPLSYGVDVLVSDAYTGENISDALVSLGEMSEESDLAGKASFSVYAGDYSLAVNAPRYHPYKNAFSINRKELFTVELLRSLADVKFVLKKDGDYLQTGTVSIGGQEGTTSSIGIVYFSDLETGTPYLYSISNDEGILLEDILELRTDSTVRRNITSTGNTDKEGKEEFSLFPNPAGETISLSGPEGLEKFTILNMTGQSLLQGKLDDKMEIDLSTLDAGFYILKLEDYRPLRFLKE